MEAGASLVIFGRPGPQPVVELVAAHRGRKQRVLAQPKLPFAIKKRMQAFALAGRLACRQQGEKQEDCSRTGWFHSPIRMSCSGRPQPGL